MTIPGFHRMYIGFLTLGILTVSLRGDDTCLMPGDIAITRVESDRITLLALRPVTQDTAISFSNRARSRLDRESGPDPSRYFRFDWEVPEPGLAAGQQIDVPFPSGAQLNWGDTLYLFTLQNDEVWFLYSLDLDRNGYRWRSPAPLLEVDLTSIVLGELETRPGVIDHAFDRNTLDVTNTAPTRLDILTAVGNVEAWLDGDMVTPSVDIPYTIGPSPGVIGFTRPVYVADIDDGEIYFQVMRLYGSDGGASVIYSSADAQSALSQWEGAAVPELAAVTGLAHEGTRVLATTAAGDILRLRADESWTVSFSNEERLFDIASSDDRFVAVGAAGTVWTASTQGVGEPSWNRFATPSLGDLLTVANTAVGWIAAGTNGAVIISDDGQVWNSAPPSGTSDTWWGVAAEAGTVVVAGSDGACLTYSAAEGWTRQTIDGHPELRAVAGAMDDGGNTQFCAAGLNAAVFTSEDGIDWERRAVPFLESFRSVRNVNGEWLFGAGSGSIYATTDFEDWDIRLRRRSGYAILVILDIADRVIAGGDYGSLLISSDLTPRTYSGAGAILSTSGTLAWADGEACLREFTVDLQDDGAFNTVRRQFAARLFAPAGNLLLGRASATGGILRLDGPGGDNDVAEAYGAMLRIVDWELEATNDNVAARRTFRYRIENTSPYLSKHAFLIFNDSNTSLVRIDPLPAFTSTAEQTLQLIDTVESVSLWEDLRDDEPVLHQRIFINNVYQEAVASVALDSIDSGAISAGSPGPPRFKKKRNPGNPVALDDTLWDVIAPPPDDDPEPDDYGLLLLELAIAGNAEPYTRAGHDYTAIGTFLDPATLLVIEETVTADWELPSAPDELALTSPGHLMVDPNPVVSYPRSAVLGASSTVGAPVDYEGELIPVPAELPLSVIDDDGGGMPFDDWLLVHGLEGSAPEEDPDGDAIPLLVEFALGLDPMKLDRATATLTWLPDSSEIRPGFHRPIGPIGLRFLMETSEDLQSWTPLPDTPELTSSEGGMEEWQWPPSGATTSRFWRVSIEPF